ncbi:MAG: hypothetical protein OEY07_18575, partial [Gammaproteobacteria bacterium]|nr:hypothetical protein [Gammaproteobacteria bacterium]
GDFFEYACNIAQQDPSRYQSEILDQYQFRTENYQRALHWIRECMALHSFSTHFVIYYIESDFPGEMHWQWKYVQGLGGGIPADSTILITETDTNLHIWAEYIDSAQQPLAPFAMLTWPSLRFGQTWREPRFLIYTLSGFDTITQQNINIELRVYNENWIDQDGETYFCDLSALDMVNNFTDLLDRVKHKHDQGPELLSPEELDNLLKASHS